MQFIANQHNQLNCKKLYKNLQHSMNPILCCKFKNFIEKIEKLKQLNVLPQIRLLWKHKKQQSEVITQQNNYMEDSYKQGREKQIEEGEAMARKLQAEQECMAKKNKHQDDALCDICCVGLYEQQFSILENCGHILHKDCLTQCFKASIMENNFPLNCPMEQCKKEATNFDIKTVLSSDLFNKYQEHTLKSYADMHGDSISWCPTADCGYMFFFEKDDDSRFECLECKKDYCLNCRVQWHKEMTCKEYKINSTVSEADEQFMKFVKGKKFKQCPKCKFWVQKSLGCDHMTCKCKFQFCYKCGGIYGKCECIAKAQELNRLRQEQAQNRRRKKEEKMKKMRDVEARPVRNRR